MSVSKKLNTSNFDRVIFVTKYYPLGLPFDCQENKSKSIKNITIGKSSELI